MDAKAAAKPDAFIWPIRVYWEDTDASGVVYHANYLRWFERARTEWLRARGYDQETLRVREGIAFTLAELTIRYRRPARLDDLLETRIEQVAVRRASLSFQQVLIRVADGERLAHAEVKAACVDAASFRPRPLPRLGF